MTSRDFCFWLQGFFELGKPISLDAAQTDLVKRHLGLVFLHEIDPSAGGPEVQAKLNDAHEAKPATKIGGVGPGGIVMRC